MSLLQRILIIIIMLTFYCFFFKYAAGTLSLKKLNMNSLSFYFLFIYCFFGASAIFLGFRNQYLIQKCSEETLNKTYWMIMYALIILPIGILFFEKLMGIKNFNMFYKKYCEEQVETSENEKGVFSLLVVLTIIGGIALVYTFICIGYVPLLELLKGNFSLISERASIARNFSGNQYIRNFFALLLIPSISYAAYIYYRVTHNSRWRNLFILLFIMSILCKTYDFEKAPVILYIAYFFVIEVMLDNVKDFGKVAKYVIIGITLILLMYYVVVGYSGNLFTLSSGPMGRLFITQIATCYLHVEAFPLRHVFLNGASFPKSISWFLGKAEYGIRSGRVVMEIYNPSGVANGTAGVMNSLYIAEAYANFGKIGVIIAPFVVSFFITVIPCFILKQKKTPLHMALYVIVASMYATCLVGGYVDFIYNVSMAFIVLVFIVLEAIANGGKIKIKKC